MTEAPPLNAQIIRGLNDKVYEKRKTAALEVERLIREYSASKDTEKIRAIIDKLANDFAYSVNANSRNGGLIGLAAASIALGPNVAAYLDDIVIPVLSCFSDQDSRVRYYACESMYNISKVSKADSELSVKNGAELLDRLIKDIVAEQSTSYVSSLVLASMTHDDLMGPVSMPRTTAFSLPRFIPLLAERIHAKNPYVRNFLVSWITVLDSIPDLELASFLPDFLDGLLQFLSDASKDVRYATSAVLANFLAEIREAAEVKEQQKQQAMKHYFVEQQRKLVTVSENVSEAGESVKDGGSVNGDGEDTNLKSTLDGEINWDAFSLSETEGRGKGSWVPGQEEEIQATALKWISEFIHLAKEVIISFTPQLISAVAVETNKSLYKMILETPTNSVPTSQPPPYSAISREASSFSSTSSIDSSMYSHSGSHREQQQTNSLPLIYEQADPFDYQATVEALVHQFLNEHEETRVASLDWLLMLHKKAPKKILAIDDGTFPVVKRDLQLLAQLSSSSEDEYFTRFMDIESASSMVQNLNSILITSPELSDLRKRLKNLETKDGQMLFTALYKSWCHNPVATFSLCLLAQAADLDITVNLLIQIDKLVQLLESPVFTYLRLQLLEPDKYPYLFKCLYGLLMLLPQSSAFASLKNRLTSVSSMGFLHLIPKSNEIKRSKTSSSSKDDGIKFQELLTHFRAVQTKHEKIRKQVLQSLGRVGSRNRRTREHRTNQTTSGKHVNSGNSSSNSLNNRNVNINNGINGVSSNLISNGTGASQSKRRLSAASSASATSDHGNVNINSRPQSPPSSGRRTGYRK
ncbi:8456_t:CDS:10 [Diversispora eburnea]|uniref:8456_t:CDS:1 n=1 Tax=Diversispora eburnea TaxID=1213867 RepID=A0A9N8ZWE7_9GLOM|nr:8456_t:CDS:10 [Diversispora eburnea]